MDINIYQKIEELEKRISALEAILSKSKPKNSNQIDHLESSKPTYSGAKGGILLLFEEDFFKTRKFFEDVLDALEGKGYIYKKDVIRTALYRLSKANGQLVRVEEGGKKIYVNRK